MTIGATVSGAARLLTLPKDPELKRKREELLTKTSKKLSFEIDSCRHEPEGWRVRFPDGVPERWVDFNGHMNVGAYQHVFQTVAYRHFMSKLGLDGVSLLASTGEISSMVQQSDVKYMRELKLGQPFSVHWQLLDFSASQVHFALSITADRADGTIVYVSASNERLAICVSLKQRAKAMWPTETHQMLHQIWAEHSLMEVPGWCGGGIAIRSDTRARARL